MSLQQHAARERQQVEDTSSDIPGGTVEEQDYESDSSDESSILEEKPKSRKPGDNAFRQQRLRAYNPVFTARTVIPTLFIIAIIFVPLGVAMWYGANRVQEVMIDYTQCENLASRDYYSEIPKKYLKIHFNGVKTSDIARPQWKLDTNNTEQFEDERNVCRIQFEIPHDIKPPILFFYRLKKFYANHRRYVKSFSEDQLNGKAADYDTINNNIGQNCQPMSRNSQGQIYYPCGLIANSLFNDTYGSGLQAVNGSSTDFSLTNKGIAWSTEKNRFKKTKYNYTQVVPPPNWFKRYPNGYNETNMPDLSTWYELQNWMKPAALPDFVKLALKNKEDTLKKGKYEVAVGLHFPVIPYRGSKYLYLSTRSVIGGKNYFLGISWIVAGGLCLLLASALLIVNLVKPRKNGDPKYLSWNKVEDEHNTEK
ncbi:uncharacterized protein KQ657_003990 [Scheffersomyces spartinae]|uniref:Uncharacterized protein n=1 Tax=Scheffersomyces spartinae TaxID=45513 RepID=A0A9P8AK82_9ASCO|nr:uncharacterized protein KQ657_003990 [Scheffersomyces spartinae]KAG7194882.1 hypothetical protein KQ657_003990 [Scheffersomyces spartinae]